jgi:hypothetical protein
MISHHENIKAKILDINFYLVSEVAQLSEVLTADYATSNLYLLTDILRKGEYKKMASIQPVQNLFGEHIYVYRFDDEAGRHYYAMIYDPAGLDQELVILEMFREVKAD